MIERKYLKFSEAQAPKILSNEIYKTIRTFDDKSLCEGDRIVLYDKDDPGEEFAMADIVSIYEKKLGDLEEIDLEGYDIIIDEGQLLEKMKDYYGDKINDETIAKIIKFKLV